jgi:hypothetical protein
MRTDEVKIFFRRPHLGRHLFHSVLNLVSCQGVVQFSEHGRGNEATYDSVGVVQTSRIAGRVCFVMGMQRREGWAVL